MQFEHLIDINPGSEPDPPLTREQLWQGLVLRAEQPERFLVGLESSQVHRHDGGRLRRELSFGSFTVHDTVRLIDMDCVIYDVAASEQTPAATLVMRIERSPTGRMFLRCSYTSEPRAESAKSAEREEEFYLEHLKQAYRATDRETVAIIRRMARQGELG